MAHEIFYLALYIVISFVLPLRDVEGPSQAFVLECLDPFTCLNQECPSLRPIEEDEYDQQFVEL